MANGRSGRTGIVIKSREGEAIVSALYRGERVDAECIAARFGVSLDDARKFLLMVQTAGTDDGVYLPISEEGEDRISLMPDALSPAMAAAWRLSLSAGELMAVMAALRAAGVAEDDPARMAIASGLSSVGLAEKDLDSLLVATPASEGVDTLETCVHAQHDGLDLVFDYVDADGNSTTRRRVSPIGLRQDTGNWILDAFDRGRGALRHFRLSRMADVSATESAGEVPAMPKRRPKQVKITFRDRHCLDSIHWTNLKVTSDDGQTVTATTPWYGSMWLPRQIAACAGTATTNNADVNRLTCEYAQCLLDEAEADDGGAD